MSASDAPGDPNEPPPVPGFRRLATLAAILAGLFFTYWLVTRERRPEPLDLATVEAERLAEQRRQEAAAEQQRRTEEQAAAARLAKEREEHQNAEIAANKAMTPAGRLKKMAASCSAEASCDQSIVDAIIQGATTELERNSLEAVAERGRKSYAAAAKVEEERKAAVEREGIAGEVDQYLLAQRMNPDSVKAVGPGKTTLRVQMFLCTRQFASDFANTAIGKRAQTAGFKRFVCTDGMMSTISADW